MSEGHDHYADSLKKVTTRSLRELKERAEKITALTAYDFTMAQLLDAAGIDVILVGDSAGMVVQGLDTTVRRHPRPDALPRDGRVARRATSARRGRRHAFHVASR